MSLNEGFWALWREPWSRGYTIGDAVLADLEQSVALGREIRRRGGECGPLRNRRDRRRHARSVRAVHGRLLLDLGMQDLGGEGG